MTESDRIASSLLVIERCVRCGYDLRGADVSGRCPECGTAISRSFAAAMNDRLEHADPQWLRTLIDAAVLMCCAGVWEILCGLPLIGLQDCFQAATHADIQATRLLTGSVGRVLVAVPLWKWFTTEYKFGRSESLRRCIAGRAAALCWLCAGPAVVIFHISPDLGLFVMILYMGSVASCTLLAFLRIGQFAERSGCRSLRTQALFLLCVMPIVSVYMEMVAFQETTSNAMPVLGDLRIGANTFPDWPRLFRLQPPGEIIEAVIPLVLCPLLSLWALAVWIRVAWMLKKAAASADSESSSRP